MSQASESLAPPVHVTWGQVTGFVSQGSCVRVCEGVIRQTQQGSKLPVMENQLAAECRCGEDLPPYPG